jgi:hypothetical protein
MVEITVAAGPIPVIAESDVLKKMKKVPCEFL